MEIDGKATFTVAGRIHMALKVSTRNNGAPMYRLMIQRKAKNYVTVLLFGECVPKLDLYSKSIVTGSPDNPFVNIDGYINETWSYEGGNTSSVITLIGSSVIIVSTAVVVEKTAKNILDEIIDGENTQL